MKKLSILIIFSFLFVSCSKTKLETSIKKPAPILYGDPKLAVDSSKMYN